MDQWHIPKGFVQGHSEEGIYMLLLTGMDYHNADSHSAVSSK